MIEKVEQVSNRGIDRFPTRKGPELSPAERAEQLWGLFNEYSAYRRGLYREGLQAVKGERKIAEVPDTEKADVLDQLGKNPLVQRLEGEISSLWQDPQVRGVFVAKVRESLREHETHKPDLKKYHELKTLSGKLEEEYFDLLRNQFLMRQMTPTLRAIDMSRNRAEKDLIKLGIENLETTGGMTQTEIDERGGLDKEHADLAAMLGYERIKDYHQQFKKEGIVLTDTRESLLDEVTTNTSAGTWMLLIGETGSGKTSFAKTTSRILNGEPPQYASGEKWGDVRTLIGTKTMDAQGRVYYEFGPLTTALTGCHNSLEMEECLRTGREMPGKVLLVDELNKFDQDALFGALKVASTLRPGEEFSFKELPGVRLRLAKKGFALLATMNPSTIRYERKPLDPALERLFYNGKKVIDYLPMTAQKPELYEVFLGILMDDNGRIRVSLDELAPKYQETEVPATRITKKELSGDVKSHGALYRFALAAAEIHKSFNQKENAAKTVTDDGFLERTVLDMDVLVKWMQGYAQQIEGGLSLTAYLERKLSDFYDHIESVNDREIFRRIFSHFGFNEPESLNAPRLAYTPLTPTEIGYLTPRTPREVRREGEDITPKTQLYIDPNTGDEIRYRPDKIQDESGAYVCFGSIIQKDGKEYAYLGIDDETGDAVCIPFKDFQKWRGINGKPISVSEATKPKDRMVERAREILGKDFLGTEEIKALEAKLKAKGVNVEFTLDNVPPFPYSEEDLGLAKQNGEMVTLRVEKARINGQEEALTIMNFRELFRQDPVGNIATLFYSFRPDASDWYPQEDFAAKPGEIKLGWAIVKKELLPDSTGKNWQKQEEVLKQYANNLKSRGATNTQIKRRTATEATWDTLLYYATNKEQLLKTVYDWTSSRASDGGLVLVGYFDSSGLGLDYWNPSRSYDCLGVCPSR